MLKFEDNYPLSKATTLKIGGPAKKFVVVKTQNELIEAIQYAKNHNLDYLIIGGGSNLLVADEGVSCLVIKNEIEGITTPKGPARSADGSLNDSQESFGVNVKSGTLLQDLVSYTITHGLSGLQKLTGIPGTVGGAVYGNAGAYGQSISDYLISVVILGNEERATPESLLLDSGRASLARMTLSKEECNFNYRDSIFKKTHDTILGVTFQLEPGDSQILAAEAKGILAKRLVKYPAGIKCPGSFFKNIIVSTSPKEVLAKIPKSKIVFGKIPAGTLLEMVGAHGQCLNGIAIAPYHANLFINEGTGTAKSFYSLAKTYALKVKEKFNITLEPEVQLINLPPLN